MNPFLARGSGKTKSHHGRQSEKRIAKDIGADLTIASGAFGDKGDMMISNMLIESKSTATKTLSLKHEWLDKIAREAMHTGKIPALVFSYCTDEGLAKPNGDWVALPAKVFFEALAYAEEELNK